MKKDSQMPPNKYKMNFTTQLSDRQNKNTVTHTCNSFLDIQTHFCDETKRGFEVSEREREREMENRVPKAVSLHYDC
jgi:hypothetical protein